MWRGRTQIYMSEQERKDAKPYLEHCYQNCQQIIQTVNQSNMVIIHNFIFSVL